MSDLTQAIVVKALADDYHSLALIAGGDNYVYVDKLNYNEEREAWVVKPDRAGSYAIYSPWAQKYVTRQENVNALILTTQDPNNDSPWALWRNEGDTSSWHAINSLTDWEQKIDVPGNGPYTPGQIVFTHGWNGGDNQMWQMIPTVGSVAVKSIDFDLGLGIITDGNPVIAGKQIVTNDTGTPQEQTLHFTFIETHSYKYTKETGLKVSESLEFKAGLPLLGESKVKIEVQGTWKFSEETTSEDETQVALDVPITVPPHTAMQVDVIVLQATLNVPYQAVVSYRHPDGTEFEAHTGGTFSGTNGYGVVTKFTQLGTPHNVERTPFNRLAASVGAKSRAKFDRVPVSHN
jgi:hypothetical protein